MKKTKLLTLTALTLIGLLGLSSCGEKGEKGDTGATGPAGETGPKGDKGDPGENGEDGKDGATWLTGTSKPADSLGNLGDMYLNTTNGDVYQKEESGWTLKMNIKGEDGEDGEDGRPGLNGSQGSQGETAYSNTILPSEGGYLSPSIGSGVEGTSFIINVIPDNGYYLTDLKFNGESIETSDANLVFDKESKTYTYETTMPKNGYVISASFDNKTSGDHVYIEGRPYSGSKVDSYGNIIDEGTLVSDGTWFDGGSGTEEDPLIVTSEKQFNSIDDLEIESELNFILDRDLSINERFAFSTQSFNIDLNGHTLTIDVGNIEEDYKTSVISNNANIRLFSSAKNKGVIKSTGLASNNQSSIAVSSGGILNLDNLEINSSGCALYVINDASRLEVRGCDINGQSYAIGTNAGNEENYNVSIKVDNSNLRGEVGTGLLFNIPGTLVVNDSTIMGDDQALIARGGDITLNSCSLSIKDNKKNYGDYTNNNDPWGTGNAVQIAYITLGNKWNGDVPNYNYDKNLTLNNVKFVPVEGSTVDGFDGNPYIFGYMSNKSTITASLTIDEATLTNLDLNKLSLTNTTLTYDGHNLELGSDVVDIDGTRYSKALYYLDETNNKVVVKGIKE